MIVVLIFLDVITLENYTATNIVLSDLLGKISTLKMLMMILVLKHG